MPMKTRLLEETKADFEKGLEAHEAEGWSPRWDTKNSVVVLDNQIQGDGNSFFFQSEIWHTIVLQKWEDD